MTQTSSRKNNATSASFSRRASVAILLACCSDIGSTSAFVASPPPALGPLHQQHGQASRVIMDRTVLHAATPLPSSDVSTNQQRSSSKSQYPTNEERTVLLTEAVELRRLKQVETEQLLAARQESLPLLTICRAAGYGDDLDKYETALRRGQQARDALITRNMGLVRSCVKDITKHRTLQSLSVDDLVQEGAIGLSRAVDRWNPEIGGTFSTYAMYWIRAAVFRCIAERDDLVRVPVHVTSSVRKMTAAAKEMGLELSLDPSDTISWKEAKVAKQLAEAAGLTEKALARAIQVKRRRSRGGIRSFESWMQQGEDIETDHMGSVSSSASSGIDLDHLRSELSKFLRPKEVEALSWRYGLTRDTGDEPKKQSGPAAQGRWGEAMTFVEVGKRMHVSAEYGRRLTKRALSKLRNAHDEGRLEPGLLAM
mmetsp:Transcript_29871/g.62430  ORF Transcript_29871/g.62430 Transcript_29871/m.62430 type:complete len:425 (-) Transcript_29871:635-1909(-)|eukprot:CAMPEP_0172464272 /NCGR_PEP_ID=MMETSP1065-20121228/49940_1 /TAXON_ID=265537 /ORGANISM="Amphiprora paludosa, Strain CCMP125" /LENGTH=424 /DNA_ID=CAMNT_0013220457 /DNA_START=353 /DNA_END=1627 /DNA_ORIENTATION=-